jgi:hypothetical protein
LAVASEGEAGVRHIIKDTATLKPRRSARITSMREEADARGKNIYGRRSELKVNLYGSSYVMYE